MARAAVIPGVSAADVPQQRATRGRGRTPTTAITTPADADAQVVKRAEPAKRGRKPGKTTTTATTASAKNKKNVADADNGMEDEEDDDLSFDVGTTTTTTAKRATKSAAMGKGARSTKKGPVKSIVEVEDNASSAEDDDDELADFVVTKKKAGRPAKAKPAPTATTTKSTRGRPKTVKPVEQQKEEAVATEKKTRGRRPAAKQPTDNEKTIYVATGSTMSSLAKARTSGDPTKKKKVTFADLTDSDHDTSEVEEQKPATKGTAKKATAATKSSGLKAKPVRKAGTATRGRPPKSQTAAAAKPLSPKKATQLAKGSSSSASSGDEDELAREKTVYSLVVQKSPVKTQEPQHTGLSSPVKRIMLPGQTSTPARPPSRGAIKQDENSVPSLPNPSSTLRDSVFMGSPARRPPPSTSKETIRDTPRRGPLFISHPSASKLSTAESNSFMQKLSPLKASPKKGGNLAASFMSASPEKASSTPFNAKLSLLKSPAKRIQSPFVFQKVHESRPLKTESSTAEEDVDTEMHDDDVFVDDDKGEDLSDDELSMDMKTVHNADDDDVFVDHLVEEEQLEDENEEASDVDEEVEGVDILQDHAEVVQEVETVANVYEDVEDQPEEIADEEDVEMSQDEPDMNDENRDPEDVEDHDNIHVGEINDHVESDAEMEEDVPEQEEHASLEIASEDVDSVQPTSEEMVEQTTVTEQQDTIEDHIQEPAESETTQSHEVTIHAEPEDEHDDTLPEIDTPRSNTTLQSARSSIDPREIVRADEVDEVVSVSSQGTPRFIPPAAPSPPVASPMRPFRMSYRDNGDDMSEYGASPASRRQSVFSNRNSILPHSGDAADDTFTSLAAKLDSWKPSSPAKQRSKSPERSMFSPVVPRNLAASRRSMQGNKYSQIQSMRQSLAARHSLANSVVMDGDESDTVARQSPEKDPSESVVGEQPQAAQSETSTAKPHDKPPRLSMSITPVRVNRDAIRTVHTVSKVPLKPEADESPIKYPRKRARSMSIDIQLPIRAPPGRVKLVPKSRKSTTPDSPTPTLSKRNPLAEIKDTPESELHAVAASTTAGPVKTPRRDPKADQQCLRGAVVFVDVHTTEGEDASGIFVELLSQMGAKCVKSWSWNPRSSQSPGVDGTESVSSKVGITHVVYKDGGVRTMEKVRQAGDLVKCVGVGWVLDCERANKWVDEAHYCVDSTIIPRGGAKRRKSMQPRALANVNGSLHSSTSSSSSSLSSSIGHGNSTSNRRSRHPTDLEDTVQDFRRMSPNNSVNELSTPKTPTSAKPPSNNNINNNGNDDEEDSEYNFNFNFDFSAMSPATPGFLRLTQQTCPPKQSNQGLFSSMLSDSDRFSSLDDSSSGANLRAKLEAARRKSLAFKPRFGSPLSRS
ncbi:hypothetical protein EIK77_010308 [Talaromyces pinophilus]|nr:hypothetical protein EIK77_010308 [Talaromyces pinophilus]PCG95430.1 Hypothetical protein PENO1_073510 [Penicillium occitanis (nom. inval.)]PCG95471.1 hypothetical protein PENOC_077500 [Penicillium occitanis (nom. inval.)]